MAANWIVLLFDYPFHSCCISLMHKIKRIFHRVKCKNWFVLPWNGSFSYVYIVVFHTLIASNVWFTNKIKLKCDISQWYFHNQVWRYDETRWKGWNTSAELKIKAGFVMHLSYVCAILLWCVLAFGATAAKLCLCTQIIYILCTCCIAANQIQTTLQGFCVETGKLCCFARVLSL